MHDTSMRPKKGHQLWQELPNFNENWILVNVILSNTLISIRFILVSGTCSDIHVASKESADFLPHHR